MPRRPPSLGYSNSFYTGGYLNSHRYYDAIGIKLEKSSQWRLEALGFNIIELRNWSTDIGKSGKVLSSLIWTVVKKCHLSESSL
jgi:hypothetical protein